MPTAQLGLVAAPPWSAEDHHQGKPGDPTRRIRRIVWSPFASVEHPLVGSESATAHQTVRPASVRAVLSLVRLTHRYTRIRDTASPSGARGPLLAIHEPLGSWWPAHFSKAPAS